MAAYATAMGVFSSWVIDVYKRQFNSNVAKMLERDLEDYQSLGKENILIYPVGRKVEEAVKKLSLIHI